ncbi:MAG: YabP/YqfC family sporulation protein [Oscillospiraceae bacterium]|nr:YabP/YqfC family sporulation protein [Oscillospiraceae bacterium]
MNIKKLALKYEHAKSHLNRHSSLQITDNSEIIADGCRKIVSCDESAVIIDQSRCRITVTGNDLKLRNWGSDGVAITGEINSIEFTKLL